MVHYALYTGAFPGHFTKYALLMGSGGAFPCMGPGMMPCSRNCFTAFQSAKMSPQDTQQKTSLLVAFSSKIKLNTCTVKPVLSDHSKIRPKINFQNRLSLNAGQNVAE